MLCRGAVEDDAPAAAPAKNSRSGSSGKRKTTGAPPGAPEKSKRIPMPAEVAFAYEMNLIGDKGVSGAAASAAGSAAAMLAPAGSRRESLQGSLAL